MVEGTFDGAAPIGIEPRERVATLLAARGIVTAPERFGLSEGNAARVSWVDFPNALAALAGSVRLLFLMGDERETECELIAVFGELPAIAGEGARFGSAILRASTNRASGSDEAPLSLPSAEDHFPGTLAHEEALELEGWIRFVRTPAGAEKSRHFSVLERATRVDDSPFGNDPGSDPSAMGVLP